jgi:hypothetical protein
VRRLFGGKAKVSLIEGLEAFMASDTADTRRQLLNILSTSVLVFPTAEPKAGDTGPKLAFTQDSEGRPVLPAFTDDKHLLVWLPDGSPYATAPADAFLPSALQGPFIGIALNPGSSASAFVDRSAIELVVSGNVARGEIGRGFVRRWT